MRNLVLTVGLLFTFCNSASAQLDEAVRNQAAGLVVTGKAAHPLDQELPRLEAIRNKIIGSITDKITDPRADLTAELKSLERFEKYCSRMSELVASQHPEAAQAKAWLEANAAVAGLVNSSLTGTVPFPDNSRLAELERIRTKLGRDFSGGLGRDIAVIRTEATSATSTAAIAATGRAARIAAPGPSAPTSPIGLSDLTLRVNKQQSNERVTTAIGFNIGSAGPKDPVGVTFKMRYTGPRNGDVGTLTKQFKPGESIATSQYFGINTTGLPDGNYTAILEVVDGYGNASHSTDLFTVNRKNARTFTGSVMIGGTRYDIELEVGMTGSPSVVGGRINGQAIVVTLGALGITTFQSGSVSGSIAGLPEADANEATMDLTIGGNNGRAVLTVK